MEAAVSGERMVETWIAAMETAVLCTSVNHGIAPNGGEAMKEKLSFDWFTSSERKREHRGFPGLPVISSAPQATVVAGLAVDAAGLTPGGGGVPVVSSNWFIKVV